jgi:hypothetical protein
MIIDEQVRIATVERIARYTIGIAVEKNSCIGTGTFVLVGGEKFILTAGHVLGESKPGDLRFWTRPSAPIKEKPAAEVEISEVGGFTLGVQLPIVDIWQDKTSDIAAMKLAPSFIPPEAVDVFDVRYSHEFMGWEDKKLGGLSLLLFGFPIGNSKEVFVERNRSFRFLGCAEYLSEYSVDLNGAAWSGLSSQHSKSRDFVFKYQGVRGGLAPHGFSGGGVWVLGDSGDRTVWRPDPILIGVVHSYAPRAGLLIAAKLPTFVEAHLAPHGANGA